MPDDLADDCPPDAENSIAEAPASRPAPLQRADKADLGCLIVLGAAFAGVFLFIPAIWFGGPFVLGVIGILLLALASPFLNPLERRSSKAKWWGRILTFLILAGLAVAAWLWLRRSGDRMVDDGQYSRLVQPQLPPA